MTETLLNLLTFSPTQPLLFNSGLFLFLFVAFCLGYALLSGKKDTKKARSSRLLVGRIWRR